MTIPIVLIIACCASAVFGVGFVCGRGMRRYEREWMQREASDFERTMREMGDMS